MYAVEVGSGAMIYISSFVKIGLGIQKLKGGGVGGSIYEGIRLRTRK
jgi:hypothetical protein